MTPHVPPRRQGLATGILHVVRARGRQASAALTVLLTVVLGATSSASANVPQPQNISVSQSIDPSTGHVLVSVSATWVWPFSVLHATSAKPCDNRVGAGWSVVWNDPADAGWPVKGKKSKVAVSAGATGSNGLNDAQQVAYDQSAPCGSFTQTDSPKSGDGDAGGPITASHVYQNAAAVPSVICVVMYDLGIPPGPVPRRLLVTNEDNTVVRGLAHGTYAETPGNNTCVSPNGQAKLTSATPTTTPAPVVVKSSTQIAYTGMGDGIRLLAEIGAGSVLAASLLLLLGRRPRRLPPGSSA